MKHRNIFKYGGYIAGVVLIIFGVVAIAMGYNGRQTVQSSLSDEKIVGTEDSTIPNLPVNNGDRARAMANIMRVHALEASGGLTYAELPRFLDSAGKGTNDTNAAAKDANGQPVANPARNLWVTETALSTALNMSYMAEQLAMFAMVIGAGLLLAGVGFLVIAGGLVAREPKPVIAEPEEGLGTAKLAGV